MDLPTLTNATGFNGDEFCADTNIAEQVAAADAPQISTQLVNKRLGMTDVSNSTHPVDVVVIPTYRVHNFYVNDPHLTSTITSEAKSNGVDLQITLNNATSSPQAAGSFQILGLNLGRRFERLDIAQGTRFNSIDTAPSAPPNQTDLTSLPGWNGGGPVYGQDSYSPIEVLRNSDYIFGLSIQYPVVEYKHVLQTRVQREVGQNNPQINIFPLENDLSPSMIPAGAVRTYTISIRILRANQSWLGALLPYRNYFRSTYGAVKYQRDPRPIYGPVAAFTHLIAPGNLRGFEDAGGLRPDTRGWGPWANLIINYQANAGINRFMFWAPTGLYDSGPNYPFLFMSPMTQIPAMANSLDQLRRIPAAGISMGYYQGLSTEVHRNWNPQANNRVIMDPHNSDLVNRAFAEYDIAVGLGAREIGLDAFNIMPFWDSIEWMRMLRARYPQIRWTVELRGADIINLYAGGMTFSHYRTGPDVWADFLIPGNERWALARMDIIYGQHPEWSAYSWWNLPQDIMRGVTRDLASDGYVPLHYSSVNLKDVANPTSYHAAPTWNTTVPFELRDPCFHYD